MTKIFSREEVWSEEIIEKLLKEKNFNLKNPDHDFNWIKKEDRDLDLINEPIDSVRYGIPNQVIGDFENAEIFLCLYNPGIYSLSNKELETKDEYKETGELDKYINHQMELENKLLKEFLIENNMPEEYINKDIFRSNEYFSEDNMYYNHIVSEENVLVSELEKLYFLYSKLKDDNKTKKRNVLENKLVKRIAYYFSSYYAGSFKDGENTALTDAIKYYEELFEKAMQGKKKDELFERIKEIPICNLELVPYRSKNKSDIKFNRNGLIKLSTTHYVVSIILEKILGQKSDSNPIFIMRSKNEWVKAIRYYLINFNDYDGLLPKKKTRKEIDDFIVNKIFPHLYYFKSSNASLSQNNICKMKGFKEGKIIGEESKEVGEILLKKLKINL